MKTSHEISEASDETIERCVDHADPLVLRGLLYQLTANEELAAMPLTRFLFGYTPMDRMANDADVARIRGIAVDLIKDLRDRGVTELDLGPRERLPRSLELIAGTAIPENEIEMWIEETGLDPMARGLKWKREPSKGRKDAFFVVVIGGGISGINAAVHLKAAGIPFILIEKNAGVGGTWFENRYPGIRVDSPSRGYLHLFGLEYPQPYSFCPGEHNVNYMKWVVDKFQLAEHIVYETEVTSTIWDDKTSSWAIRAMSHGESRTWQANAVISCVGFLSRPQMPDIAGLETFQGVAIHSARWPHDLDVAGKRVAIIGTGASGYQMTPVIAKTASHLTLFQRTPSWCYPTPAYLDSLNEETLWIERNFPFYANFARFRMGWMYGPSASFMKAMRRDPAFNDPHAVSAANKTMRDWCVGFIQEQLGSRTDLIDKMIPVAPPMSSRPIRIDPVDNVYSTLLRENVSLVTDSIDRITPNGISTRDTEHPFDVIVFATGFKANDFLWPMEVQGRNGVRVETLWEKDGPRAYIASMLPGFPNFFMAYGPNSNNFGGLQVIDLLEMEIRFALECIGGLIEGGKSTVDVASDAYWRFNTALDDAERDMIYMDPRVFNYYRNEHGRSSVNLPIDIRRMWRWLRDPAGGVPAGEIDAGLKPWFGGDLVVS